ncbi:hypothetical protein PVAP13_5KG511707 [Panicum virgatum]|uniref:Uncharacterized protein n=1 Tax=Panicum virgatum TaxID=38727 RepID=A0A8T0SV88_PANVG|nr:hypothetical protein PVAP13_5KG511707 [Panicum virgatum]
MRRREGGGRMLHGLAEGAEQGERGAAGELEARTSPAGDARARAMAKPVGEGRRRAARIEARSQRAARRRDEVALAREEERGGREKEGTPWPPRSGGAARRPERERGGEGERPSHVDEGRHIGIKRSRRRTSGAIRWRIGRPQIKG